MKRRSGKAIGGLVSFGFLLLSISYPFAQEFPQRPVNIVVALDPGSTQDVATRVLSSKVEKSLGQPFVVSNNGTGGGSVALGILAKEKPDGYHLGCVGSVMVACVPQVRPVAYKPEDFVPIMHFGATQYGFAVRSDSPWKTLKEFAEYAKKNPGKVTVGTLEVGTLLHMAVEFVARQEGFQWTHIPYPGGNAATTALLGGHLTAESGATTLIPHVKAGSLRLLATYGEKRMRTFPDVPTLRELGYDFGLNSMYVLLAPKGTPFPIVKKLDEAFRKAMNDPEFTMTAEKFEIDVSYRNAEDVKRYLEEAYARYGKMIKEFKIQKPPEKK